MVLPTTTSFTSLGGGGGTTNRATTATGSTGPVPPPRRTPHVLIAGAGVGGLMMAVLLERAGISFRVFERAECAKRIGGSMSVNANILGVFEQLGLFEDVNEISLPIKAIHLFNKFMKLVGTLDQAEYEELTGYEQLVFARPDLIDLLLSQIPAEKVLWSKKIISVHQSTTPFSTTPPPPSSPPSSSEGGPQPSTLYQHHHRHSASTTSFSSTSTTTTGKESKPKKSSSSSSSPFSKNLPPLPPPTKVTITCADGSFYEGDILIGADGAHSAVRTCLYKELSTRGQLPSSDNQEPKLLNISLWGITDPLEAEKYPDLRGPRQEGFGQEGDDEHEEEIVEAMSKVQVNVQAPSAFEDGEDMVPAVVVPRVTTAMRVKNRWEQDEWKEWRRESVQSFGQNRQSLVISRNLMTEDLEIEGGAGGGSGTGGGQSTSSIGFTTESEDSHSHGRDPLEEDLSEEEDYDEEQEPESREFLFGPPPPNGGVPSPFGEYDPDESFENRSVDCRVENEWGKATESKFVTMSGGGLSWACITLPDNRISWGTASTISAHKISAKDRERLKDSEWDSAGSPIESLIQRVSDLRIPLGQGESHTGTLADLIEETPRSQISRAMLEEKLFETWYHGRVVLLGDACHRMVPCSGQAGVNAMQDAVVLVNTLFELVPVAGNGVHAGGWDSGAVTAAFQEYKAKRYPLAKQHIENSRQVHKFIYAQTWFQESVRDLVMNWAPKKWARDQMAKSASYRPMVSFLPKITPRRAEMSKSSSTLNSMEGSHGGAGGSGNSSLKNEHKKQDKFNAYSSARHVF